MAKAKKKVRVVTPVGIAAYAWVHKPDTGQQYSNNKYKITLVLDSEEGLEDLRDKALAFAKEEFPTVDPDDIKLPFRSGDDHKKEEFHGKILLNAASKFAPKAVDAKRKPLPKGVQVWSGDEVRLVVNLYPYTKTEKVKEGKKLIDVQTWGVSAQLDAVQLVKKNSGNGGVDLFDDVDGFDGDDYVDYSATASDEADDSAADDNGDF